MSNGKFRTKKITFTQVSNNALRDTSLSLKAKGLYSVIQSFITIPNFELYKSFLMKQGVEKEAAFESAWKELKEHGYLVQHKLKNEKGTFYYEYELLDKTEASLELSELPSTPTTDNIPTKTTEPLVEKDLSDETTLGTVDTNYLKLIEINFEKILNNTNLTDLKNSYILHSQLLDEFELIILDMLSSEYVLVGKDLKPRSLVTRMLLALRYEHIEQVLLTFLEVSKTTKISNVKAYIQSMLFNAPTSTMCDITSSVVHNHF